MRVSARPPVLVRWRGLLPQAGSMACGLRLHRPAVRCLHRDAVPTTSPGVPAKHPG